MNRTALALTLLLLAVPIFTGFAIEKMPESVNMIPLDPPLRMDGGWEIGDTEGEPETRLPQGYAILDLWRQDLLYFALLRSDGKGGQEILLLMDVNHESADSFNYIEDSHERSGQKALYFMMISGETRHGLLYRYDMLENRFDQVMRGPFSNNMVFLDGGPSGDGNSGFVINGDAILEIDLSSTEPVEAVSIGELGGLPDIEGSFFYGSLTEDEIKYSYLETNDAGQLLINTVIVNDRDYSGQRKYTYAYDADTKQIVDMRRTEGGF